MIIYNIKLVLQGIIYKCIKIKKKRWVFSSYNGDYSDSPKYVSQLLHALYPEIEIIWLLKTNITEPLPEYIKIVEYGSKKAKYMLASAQVIFDNVDAGAYLFLDSDSVLRRYKYKFLMWLKKKKNQYIYTTWHGVPLKRMARDQIGNHYYDCIANKVTMFSKCDFERDIMDHITFGKINVITIGSPRNDILFNDSSKDLLKEKLEIPKNKKIVLFAPTFRNDGHDTEGKNVERSGLEQIRKLDFDCLMETLSNKFGGEFVFIFRLHYHVEELVDWESLYNRYGDKIINGNTHMDISEYLACSDVLITDASSVMFDFMLMQKPCFLYFPDVDNYQNNERGFYFPIESLPFDLCVSSKELIDSIKNFNYSVYGEKVSQLVCEMNMVDDGNSTQKILDYIMKEIKY